MEQITTSFHIPPSSATNAVANRLCNHSPYRTKEFIQRVAPKARVEVNRDWKSGCTRLSSACTCSTHIT